MQYTIRGNELRVQINRVVFVYNLETLRALCIAQAERNQHADHDAMAERAA